VRESLVSGLPDLRRPQALTGDPVDASTYQRLVRTAGNRNLKPEDGITKQAGFVFDVPGRLLRGLSLEFTHGVIEQKNLITSGLGTTFIRQNELASTGDLVVRDPQSETYRNNSTAGIAILAGAGGVTRLVQPGDTVTVPGRIRFITDSAVNLAQQMVRYYDYGARYRLRTSELGSFSFSSSWTYMGFYAARRFQNDPVVSSVGRSLPRYRGQSSLFWQHRAWAASLSSTYIHRHRDLTRDGWEVNRYHTFGSSLSYGWDKRSRMGDLRLTFGLDNMFDRQPPLDNSSVGYNQGLVGRPGGRFAYLSARRSF
jgi:hypothetical protein